MKKKIVAYLLCMAMGVSLLPMPVTQAADNGTVVYEEETMAGTEADTATDTRTEISFNEKQYLEMKTPGKDWTSQQATETVKFSENDENYSIDSVSWYDITNNVDNKNPMKDEEKFQEGNNYTAKVTLKVKDDEKKFGDDSKSIKIKVDQSDAKEFEEKDIEISDDGKKMTLSYSFSIEHVHTYQAAWTWKADYTEATLKISCTSCGAIQMEDITVSSQKSITESPTCIKPGTKTYTATVKVNGQSYSDIQTVDIPATGHKMTIKEESWEYSTDGQNWEAIDENTKLSAEEAKNVKVRCTPITKCEKDDKTEKGTAITGSKVEKESQEPGCTEDGYYTYTVKVEGKDVSEKVAIGKTGHNMSITGGRWEYSTDGKNWKTIDTDTKLSVEEVSKVEVRYIPIATCDKNDKTEERDAVTGSKVEKESQEPGCTEDGYYTYTVKVEGKDVSEKVAIGKTGHNMSITGGRWEYSTDGKNWKTIDTDTKLSVEEVSKVEVRYIPIATCDKNDKTEERAAVTGSKIEKESQEPGCTEDGYYTYEATITDEQGNSTKKTQKVVIKATGHDIETIEAVSATCDKDGNIEYYQCKICGKYFSDADGKNAIEEGSWIVKATGHKLEKTQEVAATCEKDGNDAYYTCKNENCGKYFSDKEGKNEIKKDSWVRKATGHQIVEEVKKQPTKKVEGQLVRHCKNCDYVKETLALPKKEITIYVGAKAKEVPKVASTYNTSDYRIAYAKTKNAKTYGKYFNLKNANKTGNLKVTIKANSKKLSQVKLKTVPLKVTVAGKEYKTNVKVKIKAPKITITTKKIEFGGTRGTRYYFDYNLKGATKIKVRAKKLAFRNKEFDRYISTPKSNEKYTYFNIKESDLKNLGNKISFEIVAYYGKNISEKYKKTVSAK